MKLVRTLSIVLAMATAAGPAFAAPDAKPAPAAPAPTSALVQKMIAFIDAFSDKVASDKGACPKMATDINAMIDDNKDLLVQAKAARQSGKPMPADMQDHFTKGMQKMMPAYMGCKDDQGVKTAFQRLDMR
jgi:hypothetical protein